MAVSDELEVGDIVTLKSGGPDMTVVQPGHSADDQCKCSWFAGGKLQEGWFPKNALEKKLAEE